MPFVLENCCRKAPQQWNNDRPTWQGPTMCGDVLSYAKAESGDDYADPAYAAVPTAPHAGGLAVKPCGISTNRIVDAGTAARERTARNSLAGHKEIFPKYRLGAHPRAQPRRPALILAAREAVAGSGNSADGGTPGHGPSVARLGWHANAASDRLHPDTPHCNTAPGHTQAGKTAHSLSIGSGAALALDKSLALKKIANQNEVDPRERQLPKGQVPERISIPLRDDLYPLPFPSASLCSRLITRLPGRHFLADRPPRITAGHPPCWSAKWLSTRPPLTGERQFRC